MAILARTASVLIVALSRDGGRRAIQRADARPDGTCRPLDRKRWSIRIDTQRCVKTENEARAKLVDDWAKYSAADRACAPRPPGWPASRAMCSS